MKRLICLSIVFLLTVRLTGQALPDSILGHPARKDANGTLQAWYKPDVPGAGYLEVIRLASEFIKNPPLYEPLGLDMFYITCCFHKQDAKDGGKIIAEDWMHNPACIWAGLVQGLALDYRVYSGDDAYIDVVRNMLDYQLNHGTTPEDWPWPNVPYASADPFEPEYRGAVQWQHDGMRGDGLHGIEPDKLGELGYAYLKFYQITGEKRFLTAALHCADALAHHVRDVRPEKKEFIASDTERSPWPFRVNARTDSVISEYCSNVIEPIKLLDELIRPQSGIKLTEQQIEAYQKARTIAWEWLFSINGPIKTHIWNAYFEDIPNDTDRTNRVQITPLETARYLIKHPEMDPDIDIHVPALIHYVSSAFATEGFDAVKEQTWCYLPMGSHSSRYASVCALWYERTGDAWYLDQARRFFNYATYMCYPDGVVAVGHTWASSWWSDGYSDYIKHFTEGVAAVPEWAPGEENHLLKSTSVVQRIRYQPDAIQYQTYDAEGTEILRLKSKPVLIYFDKQASVSGTDWQWQTMEEGGLLTVVRHSRRSVRIQL